MFVLRQARENGKTLPGQTGMDLEYVSCRKSTHPIQLWDTIGTGMPVVGSMHCTRYTMHKTGPTAACEVWGYRFLLIGEGMNLTVDKEGPCGFPWCLERMRNTRR